MCQRNWSSILGATRSDGEVIVFHKHLGIGNEPKWFYTLNSLVWSKYSSALEQRRSYALTTLFGGRLQRETFGVDRPQAGYVSEALATS
jgi:hypothetical protein